MRGCDGGKIWSCPFGSTADLTPVYMLDMVYCGAATCKCLVLCVLGGTNTECARKQYGTSKHSEGGGS